MNDKREEIDKQKKVLRHELETHGVITFEKNLKGAYPKLEIRHCHDLVITPAHFVIDEWTTD